MKKNILIGFVIGLIANAIGLFIAATLLGDGDSVIQVLKAAKAEGFLGKLMSLGAILNLIVFFLFITKRKDHKARGVLIATVLVALLTFIIKL